MKLKTPLIPKKRAMQMADHNRQVEDKNEKISKIRYCKKQQNEEKSITKQKVTITMTQKIEIILKYSFVPMNSNR